jgi:plasmid maintenance system antidote protein VapI
MKTMKLNEFLDRLEMPIAHFAKKIGVDKNALHKILNGAMPRFDTAIKIEEATLGMVPYKNLAPIKQAKKTGRKKKELMANSEEKSDQNGHNTSSDKSIEQDSSNRIMS